MNRLNDVIKTLVFGVGLIALGSAALAADEVLEVRCLMPAAMQSRLEMIFHGLKTRTTPGMTL